LSGSITSPDPTQGGSMFTSPFWSALANAGAAFGQGAMPVPFKGGIPFGATLGQAGAAFMGGAQNAYANQIAQAQARQQQMATQLMQMQMPMQQAGINFRTQLYQHPELLYGGGQSMFPGAPGGFSGGVPGGFPGAAPTSYNGGADYGPSINKALSLVPPAARHMVINAAFGNGNNMSSAEFPVWLSTLGQESGFNLNAPDGKAGEIGVGQVLPNTGKMLGYTTDQLRDPQTNLIASARYHIQGWQQSGGNPAQTAAYYNAGDINKPDPNYVNPVMDRLNQWGYPGANSQSTAGGISQGDALQLAGQLNQQANALEEKQRLAQYANMPLPEGSPAALRAQADKYLAMALQTNVTRSGTIVQGGQVTGRAAEMQKVFNPQTQQYEYRYVGGFGSGVVPGDNTNAGIPASPPIGAEAAANERAKVAGGAGIMLPPPGQQAAPGAPPSVPGPVSAGQQAPGVPQIGTQEHPRPGVFVRQLPGGGQAVTDNSHIMQADYERDAKDMTTVGDELQELNLAGAQLNHTSDLIQQNPKMGAGGNFRANLANIFQTYMPSSAAHFAANIMDLPDAATSQELAKMLLKNAGQSERQDLGARGGFRAMEMYTKAFPSNDTQQNAAQHMMNMLRIMNVANMDYLNGALQYFNQQGTGFKTGQSDYAPVTQYDQRWMASNSPRIYAAAIAAANGANFSDWSKGLNKTQGLQALQIVGRVDPTMQINGDDGNMWSVSRFMPGGGVPQTQGTAQLPPLGPVMQ
jgi:hypothetical protein